MTKDEMLKMLQREQNFAHSMYKECQELRSKLYDPMKKDKQLKEIAAEFGRFLMTMKVTPVNYPKTFKTNCGMAPDIIIESMEDMFQRFINSKS